MATREASQQLQAVRQDREGHGPPGGGRRSRQGFSSAPTGRGAHTARAEAHVALLRLRRGRALGWRCQLQAPGGGPRFPRWSGPRRRGQPWRRSRLGARRPRTPRTYPRPAAAETGSPWEASAVGACAAGVDPGQVAPEGESHKSAWMLCSTPRASADAEPEAPAVPVLTAATETADASSEPVGALDAACSRTVAGEKWLRHFKGHVYERQGWPEVFRLGEGGKLLCDTRARLPVGS